MPDIREHLLSRARTIPAKINHSAFSVAALAKRIAGLFYKKSGQKGVEQRTALKSPKMPESEIAALIRCSGEALEHVAFKEFATIVSNECKNTIGAEYGYIVVRETEEEDGEFVYRDPSIEGYVLDFSLSLPIQRLMAKMYKSCDVVAGNDLASLGATEEACAFGTLPVANALFIPLVFHDETVGFMAFANKPGGFTEDDRQTGNAFGKIASIVLHSERIMEELKANEQKFRSVAESSKNAFLTVNSAGRIVFWNESAERIFGYRNEEIVNKPFSTLGIRRSSGAHGAGESGAGVKSLPAVGDRRTEMRGMRKDGKEFPIEMSTSSWRFGQERYYTSIIVDSTRRKESERKLREYAREMQEGKARDEALLLSIADGILVADTYGKIVYVNGAMEKLSGRRAKDLLDRDLDEAIPLFDESGRQVRKEDRPIYVALDPEKQNGTPTFTSTTFYLVNKKDKRKIPLSTRAAPFIVGGEILGAVVVCRDSTEEKEIDREKTEFISFASHQLRTPLTSISLSIDMLLHHLGETLSKEQKKYLQIALEGTRDMTDTIETLLNISRIQMGTLVINPEPTSLPKFLDKIVSDGSVLIKKKGIKIKKAYAARLPRIKIDQRLMRIVLENIISNAVKYSPAADGVILIEIKKKKDDILIAISDRGGGIPKDQQARVFEKLFRVQTDNKVKGTGLGLYIVKAAVDQYGGRVWCESPSARASGSSKKLTGQKGTTFYVTVPLAGMTAGEKAAG